MKLYQKYRAYRRRKHIAKWGHRNVGHFNALNKKWFREHQKGLLYLVNHPLLKYLFRFPIGLHNNTSYKKNIIELCPNNRAIHLAGNKYQREFYTAPFYSKRIYYSFFPIWWVQHFIDLLLLDRFAPQYSFGFDTLTVYPDADPETDTFDGYSKYANNDYATARSNSTSANMYDNITNLFVHQYNSGDNTSIARGFLLFDTSDLDGAADISVVDLSLTPNYMRAGDAGHNDLYVFSVITNSNTSITNTDFNINNFGTTSFAYKTQSSMVAWTPFNLDLNASGISHINKTGVTKFGLRSKGDIDNTEGTEVGYTRYNQSDYGGTTYVPILEITYTVPSGYIMDVTVGEFTLTGNAAGLLYNRKLNAAVGAFTLTGNSAGLIKDSKLSADKGVFTLTGNDAAFSIGYGFAADVGAFTLTGNAAGLLKNSKLPAVTGAFTLTGNDAALLKGYALLADKGTFSLTGNDAAFLREYLLQSDTGAFALTGKDIALLYGRELAATAGTFTLTGLDVELIYSAASTYTLNCSTGVFTLSGNAVEFLRTYILAAETGAFTLTGNDVIFSTAQVFTIDDISTELTESTRKAILSSDERKGVYSTDIITCKRS